MTINETLLNAKLKLESVGIPTPWLDSELLLAHILHVPREYLTSHPDLLLAPKTIKLIDSLTERRARHEPLAYLTGEKEFFGLTFKVTPDVLIPRPATEELVETIIKHCTGRIYAIPAIIDIGTGSGCIAVTLAEHLPNAHILATDISEAALAVARVNAETHGVLDRITFLQGDLLQPLINTPLSPLSRGESKVCVLVANLPYLPSSTLASNPDLAYEPHIALDGGPDGILLYRRLFNQLSMISDQLMPTLIFLEISPAIITPLLSSPELNALKPYYHITPASTHITLINKLPMTAS